MLSDKLVGAIDEGTQSCRFILFRAQTGEVVCKYQKELKQIHPGKEAWVEQDPTTIMTVVSECIEKCIEQLIKQGGNVKNIVAVGVTNQRETTIVWDKDTGEPLYNAIVWLDMRTQSTVQKLVESTPDKNANHLKPICGLPISTYFSAVKLRWLIDNVPAVQEAIDRGTCMFGTVDSWIIYNLTGGKSGGLHATDVTNASRTMLMNLETLQWDDNLIDFFGIHKRINLPAIKSSSEIYGHIKTGALSGVPISGCIGDQQAALVGQQCLQKGQAKATYGTGCFLLLNTGAQKVDSKFGLITTVGYKIGNEKPVYAMEGSVAVAGAAVSWLKDNLNLLNHAKECEAEALSVKDNGDVYFVPAFSGLYSPWWRGDARGVICGITLDTQRGHLIRATLEAVCFQVRDVLEAMNNDCGIPLSALLVDGGMTENNFLMQSQSDIIGIDVIKPSMAETTSLGCAMLAGHAVGVWDLSKEVHVKKTVFNQKVSDTERQQHYKRWKMAVDRSFGWASVDIA
ncbi:unnamed protein product [Sphagnum compactum]